MRSMPETMTGEPCLVPNNFWSVRLRCSFEVTQIFIKTRWFRRKLEEKTKIFSNLNWGPAFLEDLGALH